MNTPPWIDGMALRAAIPYPDAAHALADALSRSDAIGAMPPRLIVDTAAGQVLLMPAEVRPYAGVKIVTIAPANPDQGLPRINGVYVLLDSATLRPLALLEAAALTAVRTAAVSALAVDRLAAPTAHRLVVFGAGPQALAHVEALAAVRPLRTVAVVARSPKAASVVIDHARRLGLAASAAGPDATAEADLVACCTTAREPLFDSSRLRDDATVVAVGSHEPDVRELDSALMRRATVVVESRASAATAGDVVLAAEKGRDIVAGDLSELVAGRIPVAAECPRVFKSVGEAWEDLVVAAAAYDRTVVRG
jgi:ornithine cyclodeaminase